MNLQFYTPIHFNHCAHDIWDHNRNYSITNSEGVKVLDVSMNAIFLNVINRSCRSMPEFNNLFQSIS